MGDTTPQDRAVEALHERFDLTSGVISLEPPSLEDMRRYAPTTPTGPSKLDFRHLSIGEILDCLADAGLLSSGTQEDQGEEGDGSQDDAGCRCGACGNRYRVDLNIPDELWRGIGMPEHSGLLCGRCIMTRLEGLAASANGFGYLLAHEGCVAGDGSLRSGPSAEGEATAYVLLSGRQVSHTVEHYNGAVMVDMDDYDEPVGVEILDAREVTVNGCRVHPPKASGEAATEKP